MTFAGNWLLFFHILAVLWLVGGVFGGIVVRAQIRRADSLTNKVFGLRMMWRLTSVFIQPGALGAGLLGVALAARGPYSFGHGWVFASLLIFLLMLGNAIFLIGPRLRRTLAAGEASILRGEPTPDFVRLGGSKVGGILADLNALGIVVLTFLMVLKPF